MPAPFAIYPSRLLQPLALLGLLAGPATAATQVFQSFEGDGFDDWKVEGPAFGLAPVVGKVPGMKADLRGQANDSFVCSAHGGPAATGTLTSPEFTVRENYITFLIAGGDHPGQTAAQLWVDGKAVREATGKRDLDFRPVVWDVSEFTGKKATLRLIDQAEDSWGFIAVDHVIFTDYPNQKFPNSTRGGKEHNAGLVADPDLPGVTRPPDVALSVAADSKTQQVISPTALAFDEQGRVFVSETHRFRFGVMDDRDHLYWYFDDLAAQTTADRRAMHEKWQEKVPLASLTEKTEIVRKLEDTTGDGAFDASRVYADGFDDLLDGTAAGVFSFEGTTYFACIPKLWMLRDTDGDGVADERKVIEDGFGVRVSFSGHDMNGFALGPDGRIYGTIGDRGFSLTTKEGRKYHYPDQGAAFRFDPDGTNFEVFHTGLRNPKEIAFDRYGNALSVDNNSDQGDAARVVYLVEGGDSGWEMEHQTMHSFHRQIGLADRPPSRWMDEKMWELRNDSQPAYIVPPSAHLTSGPSGLTYHPGTGFLQSEADRFLICDYRGSGANSGIWSFEMAAEDAGMKMASNRKFIWGVAATDVEYSWDGKLFVTDFIGGWSSHQDGRLLAVSANEPWQAKEAAQTAAILRQGLSKVPSDKLAPLLRHPDGRLRLRAQVELTRRPDAFDRFTAATRADDPMERIHGVWGLGILARRGAVPSPATDRFSKLAGEDSRRAAASALAALLDDPDVEFRAQALRALADASLVPDGLNTPLTKILKDPSPRVRFFAAIAIGKLKVAPAFDAVCGLLADNADRDTYLRHAGVYALEHMGVSAEKIAGLKSYDSASVRLAATVALRRMKSDAVGDFAGDRDSRVADEAIRAIYDNAVESRREAAAAWLDRVHDRSWTPFMLRRLLHHAFRAGDGKNLQRLLNAAADTQLPVEVRKEALRLVSILDQPPAADQLSGHYRPLPARPVESFRAILGDALPSLLKGDDFVLTAAFNLVDHYRLTSPALDAAFLRSVVANEDLPAEARAKALDLFVGQRPATLGADLVGFSGANVDAVALAALAQLAKIEPNAALGPLEKAIASGSDKRAQQAWSILAAIPGEEADRFFVARLQALQAARGVSPAAIELLQAAKTRQNPAVAEALAAFDQAMAADADPLAKWHPALEGGDASAGASLFSSHPAGQCMRCHRAGDGHSPGGDAGPNLAGIATRHDRRYLLEAMVLPGASIAPGYGIVSLDFRGKGSLGGKLLEETPDHIDLLVDDHAWRVKRSDIADFVPPASAMPAMEYLLKPSELRDLVAWLSSLDQPPKDAHSFPEPKPFDPATLKAGK